MRYVAYIRPANQSSQLIMELVNGPDLQKVLQPPNGHSELGVLEIRDMLRQLLEAVCYVHRQGIIHRDLKPANILVAQRKPLRIKLADFSEATRSGSFKPGQFFGTPPYTAPEMIKINGPECTQKVDMFAIGAIALQLLYGFPRSLQKLKQRPHAAIPEFKAMLECVLHWRD
jgi:serine/threonine protein kinase